MKKSYIKILLVELFLIAVILFNVFINILGYYTLALFLLLAFIALLFLVGFEKSKHRFKKDILLNILIYSILYYLITYFSGIIIGFLKSGYSLAPLAIIENALPIILIIIVSELLRYELIKKGEGSKLIYVLSVIIFVLADITLLVSNYNFLLLEDIIKFTCGLLLPSIAKNIMLTYLTYVAGYKIPIIYRLIFEVPTFFLPIFPDLGLYLESILGVLFPAIIIYNTYFFIQRAKNKDTVIASRKEKKTRLLAYVVIFTFFFITAYLTSGFGKVYAITIGSGSMAKKINKGDIVIVEKLSDKEKENIEKGEILVFHHANKLIIHRVISKVTIKDEVFYYTKGDANASPDGYPIEISDVVGTAMFRIPFIGYPTVSLNELLERSK